MSINPENIDLDGINLESLDVEDKILVLRLKGEIGSPPVNVTFSHITAMAS